MKDFQIETAQNIGITQNVAHLGDRLIGYIIDSLIILFYSIAVILLLVALDVDGRDQWSVYLIATLPAFLYYVLLETFWDGKTVGKYVQQTRVVKLDGSKPNFGNYLVRWLLRIVDVVMTLGGVAVLTILIRGNGQRLGDLAAGTTVISERRNIDVSDTLLKELPADYVPTFSQVTMLSDADMQTIKSLYEEALKNGHHNVILNLHARLCKIMEVETKLTPREFVHTVIGDYNYFTQNMS